MNKFKKNCKYCNKYHSVFLKYCNKCNKCYHISKYHCNNCNKCYDTFLFDKCNRCYIRIFDCINCDFNDILETDVHYCRKNSI